MSTLLRKNWCQKHSFQFHAPDATVAVKIWTSWPKHGWKCKAKGSSSSGKVRKILLTGWEKEKKPVWKIFLTVPGEKNHFESSYLHSLWEEGKKSIWKILLKLSLRRRKKGNLKDLRDKEKKRVWKILLTQSLRRRGKKANLKDLTVSEKKK